MLDLGAGLVFFFLVGYMTDLSTNALLFTKPQTCLGFGAEEKHRFIMPVRVHCEDCDCFVFFVLPFAPGPTKIFMVIDRTQLPMGMRLAKWVQVESERERERERQRHT